MFHGNNPKAKGPDTSHTAEYTGRTKEIGTPKASSGRRRGPSGGRAERLVFQYVAAAALEALKVGRWRAKRLALSEGLRVWSVRLDSVWPSHLFMANEWRTSYRLRRASAPR